MKACHGRTTDLHTLRASQMIGDVATSISEKYRKDVTGAGPVRHQKQKDDHHNADVRKFVTEYRDEELYKSYPGRQHSAYQCYQPQTKVPNPKELVARINKHSSKLDRSRAVRADY